jgi:putative transposase
MYTYRSLSPAQQQEVVEYRRQQRRPWHSPPHWDYTNARQFIISGACYEHAAIIGQSHQRLTECEHDLLAVCESLTSAIYAWCILPNHYHLLVRTEWIKALRKAIGQFHGRTSYRWNLEDEQRGRQTRFNCFDRPIKSNRHFWASVNYIHHNPVKHGYVETWQDWPWSSAPEYLERVGQTTAQKIWREFPILDYGKNWDIESPSSQKGANA